MIVAGLDLHQAIGLDLLGYLETSSHSTLRSMLEGIRSPSNSLISTESIANRKKRVNGTTGSLESKSSKEADVPGGILKDHSLVSSMNRSHVMRVRCREP